MEAAGLGPFFPHLSERRITVLIIDEDAFEAGYVASVLEPCGIDVVGPFPDMRDALAAIETDGLQAAVIGRQDDAETGGSLLAALHAREVPYLSLLHGIRATTVAAGHPVLAKPFAAYQVADWILANHRPRPADGPLTPR